MGLSKKHFKAIAQILHASEASENLIDELARYFKQENERFDSERFQRACHGLGIAKKEQ